VHGCIVRGTTDSELMRHVSGASAGARIVGPMAPITRPPHRPTGASLAALIGVAAAFAGVAVLHVVRADLDPRQAVMSHYANGSAGPVMSIVFYAFGAAALTMAIRLWTAIDRHGVTRAFPPLMATAGGLMLLAGVFEVDRPDAPQTIGEVVHSNSAVAGFVLLVVSMALFTRACGHDERWRSFRRRSAVLTAVAAAAAIGAKVSTGTSWTGAVQRVLAGAVLLWLLLAARHVRSRRFAAPAELDDGVGPGADGRADVPVPPARPGGAS
jgi:hypothetical protein